MNQEGQLVIFQLNDQQYALPIQQTQEIVKMTAITRVPNTRVYVEGIINLRGNVIPVINMNRRLNLPVSQYNDATRIIVVELKGQKLGIIVDNVTEVRRYAENEVEPPSVVGDDVDYLNGVVKKENNLWLLLNLEKVL